MSDQVPTILLSDSDVEAAFSGRLLSAVDVVEDALRMSARHRVLQPDKSSQIFDEALQSRINCMPATLLDAKVSGVKWVSVFPGNPGEGYRNVNGLMVLSEILRGFPLAVMSAAALTSIRTAAVGSTAAKYLAPSDPLRLGLIGSGCEARRHAQLLCAMFPTIASCAFASRSAESTKLFWEWGQECLPGVGLEDCGSNLGRAVCGADIVVTATSAQAPLLKAEWLKPGALYVHVGGWEDEFDVAKRCDKIVCDDWHAVKHRGSQTLSRAYRAGVLCDGDIYANLDQIVAGSLPGREGGETVYFNSVGLSFLDVAFANFVYRSAVQQGGFTNFNF